VARESNQTPFFFTGMVMKKLKTVAVEPKVKRTNKLDEAKLARFTEAALKVSGLFWFRVHLGGIPMVCGPRIILRSNPMKGFPDYCIVTKAGILSGLELKSPSGTVKPEQKEWQEKLEANNCNYCLARTEEQVLDFIDRLGGWSGRAVYIK